MNVNNIVITATTNQKYVDKRILLITNSNKSRKNINSLNAEK